MSYHLGHNFNDRLSIEGSSMILRLTFVSLPNMHDGRSFRHERFFVQKYALWKLRVFYSSTMTVYCTIVNFFRVYCRFSKTYFKEKFHRKLLIFFSVLDFPELKVFLSCFDANGCKNLWFITVRLRLYIFFPEREIGARGKMYIYKNWSVEEALSLQTMIRSFLARGTNQSPCHAQKTAL